uniref:Uncharacterized protein n=1 Tax=Macrostomum lignano TaxID=282301 RepID=A0A1I8F9N0_9PLAT
IRHRGAGTGNALTQPREFKPHVRHRSGRRQQAAGRPAPGLCLVSELSLPLLSVEDQSAALIDGANLAPTGRLSSNLPNSSPSDGGIDPRRLRFPQHPPCEMAHYAADCWDAECLLTTAAGVDWVDRSFTPSVVEPSSASALVVGHSLSTTYSRGRAETKLDDLFEPALGSHPTTAPLLPMNGGQPRCAAHPSLRIGDCCRSRISPACVDSPIARRLHRKSTPGATNSSCRSLITLIRISCRGQGRRFEANWIPIC